MLIAKQFFSSTDLERAASTFRKLARHDLSGFVLTGGIATEIHCLRKGRKPALRPLNDLDFVVNSFEHIPATLTHDFLFRHIHPSDPPGKTLLQFVDRDTGLRIDVFRAFGETTSRALVVEFLGRSIRLIALEDLLARCARLALDLAGDVPTPSKYARDYLRLAELVQPEDVEVAWQEQRKAGQPQTFREADSLLRYLIPTRRDLLINPEYSKNPDALCPRCTATPELKLADPRLILSVLGYC